MAHETNELSRHESPAPEKWYVKLARFVWWVTRNALLMVTWPALLLILLAAYVVLSIISIPVDIHDAWERHKRRRSEKLGARR